TTLLYSTLINAPAPKPPLFPYTTLFRSAKRTVAFSSVAARAQELPGNSMKRSMSFQRKSKQSLACLRWQSWRKQRKTKKKTAIRSEEHTSELQSPCNLVCRLLLEKKKYN